MKPRERVMAALAREVPDRVPRFEIWIDDIFDELGRADEASLHARLGQDCVMMPTIRPPGSNAWATGVDEWGRVWKDGMYADGVVVTHADLERYSHPASSAEEYFDDDLARAAQEGNPDHCLIFGTHEIGPLTASYMAMGFERFFVRMVDDPDFAHRLLANRTEWSVAMCQKAVALGAEVIVVGDDAAGRDGPMISPAMWREFVLPCHRQIVESVAVPVLWHSDGYTEPLLPFAIEAGFAGFHGLEPAAGVRLDRVKEQFGSDLVLVGNIDIRVLFQPDLGAIHAEVNRSVEQGAQGGGYMLATCNSIFAGMDPAAVAEMFHYQEKVGFYGQGSRGG